MTIHRRRLLAAISALGILGFFFVGRIPQDPNYHLFADTKTLAGVANFWNVFSNLPFLAVGAFALLLAERVIAGYNQRWLWALVGIGIAAALYWSWTEAHGKGDLRPYAVVQFLPIVLMPLIMALFPRRYLSNALLICAFAWYFVAKGLEHYDDQILSFTGVIGGHPLKHVAAAIAVLCIVRSVPTRRT